MPIQSASTITPRTPKLFKELKLKFTHTSPLQFNSHCYVFSASSCSKFSSLLSLIKYQSAGRKKKSMKHVDEHRRVLSDVESLRCFFFHPSTTLPCRFCRWERCVMWKRLDGWWKLCGDIKKISVVNFFLSFLSVTSCQISAVFWSLINRQVLYYLFILVFSMRGNLRWWWELHRDGNNNNYVKQKRSIQWCKLFLVKCL